MAQMLFFYKKTRFGCVLQVKSIYFLCLITWHSTFLKHSPYIGTFADTRQEKPRLHRSGSSSPARRSKTNVRSAAAGTWGLLVSKNAAGPWFRIKTRSTYNLTQHFSKNTLDLGSNGAILRVSIGQSQATGHLGEHLVEHFSSRADIWPRKKITRFWTNCHPSITPKQPKINVLFWCRLKQVNIHWKPESAVYLVPAFFLSRYSSNGSVDRGAWEPMWNQKIYPKYI